MDRLPPSPPLSAELLGKYLASEVTESERATVTAWAASNPRATALLETLTERATPADVTPGWEALHGRLQLDVVRTAKHAGERHTFFRVNLLEKRTGWRVGAAAVAITAIVSGLTLVWQSRASGTTRHYQTAAGERQTIRWGNGSTMTLAPATSVVVTRDGIAVNGEAYFSVQANPERPFVVHTGNATVQVLGTRFSVRQYPGEPRSRIIVEDGRVMLRERGATDNRANRAILSERMLAYVADSGIRITKDIETQNYTGWTNGALVFNNAALRDVITELSRAYGADIRIDDTVLARKPLIMDVMVSRQTLPEILNLIGLTTGAHYRVDGRTFVLTPGRQEKRTVPSSRSPNHRFPQPEKQYGR
jgi:ferric-dicitrate binding protein FerR (iron transport regulator)